jgi:hypothetical protein
MIAAVAAIIRRTRVEWRFEVRLLSLPELQDKARAINDRPLETETVGQGTARTGHTASI